LNAKDLQNEIQQKLADKTEDMERQHKVMRKQSISNREKEVKHDEVRAQNSSKLVQEGFAKEQERMLMYKGNVSHRADQVVANLRQEQSELRAYVRQHQKVFRTVVKANGLPNIPESYYWMGDYEKWSMGNPGCKVSGIQGTAKCLGSETQIGCVGGKLVSINCGCRGPFIYGGSLQISMSDTFLDGKCPSIVPPALKSSDEPSKRELSNWLGVCIFQTIKVEPPAPGTDCMQMLNAKADVKAAQNAVEEASVEAQKAQIIMSKAEKALKSTEDAAEKATAADVSNFAEKVSEHTVTWKFAESQYDKAHVKLTNLNRKLVELQMTSPVTSDSSVLLAQEELKSAQRDRQTKEAALRAAEGKAQQSSTAKEKAVTDAAVFHLRMTLLAAEGAELNMLKHVAMILHDQKQRNAKTPEPPPQAVSSVRSTSAENSKERLLKSSTNHEIHEKRLIIQTKLDSAKETSVKAQYVQRRAEEDVTDAERNQMSETHVERAKLHAMHTQRDVFFAKQRVEMFMNQLSNTESVPAVTSIHVEPTVVKGPQPRAVEAALQEAANELKKSHMNTALQPRIWTPPHATCRQGFVFATGVCVKAPFVYVKCELGPVEGGSPTLVTIQAGCGCHGRYLHSMMVGHLEQESRKSTKSSSRCIKEFQEHSEAARNKVFAWQPYAMCAGLVYAACNKYHESQAERKEIERHDKLNFFSDTSQIINDTISDYRLTIKQAVRREGELRKELADPNVWMPAIQYYKVPYLVFRDNGEEVKDIQFAACRLRCSSNRKCKSMSYKHVDETCIMSTNTPMYDENFSCYLKKRTGYDEGSTEMMGSFHMLPGMKTQEADDENTEHGSSLAQCKYDCLNSERCQAVSYSSESMVCIRAESSIAYDEQWNYYEKEVTTPTDNMMFNPNEYDKKVIQERKVKAAQELQVIKKLVTYKRKTEHEASHSEIQALERNLPEADALEDERQDKERFAAPVVLRTPP